MASSRAAAIVFSFLVLAVAAPSPLVRARMMPGDGDAVPTGRIAAPEVDGSVGAASSLQEALVQRPPLPLPLAQLMSPPTMAVFAQRSSRMLGSVPSPGVGH
ncbi:hypothetical protein VPH35_043550 [Triticum aestivum]